METEATKRYSQKAGVPINTTSNAPSGARDILFYGDSLTWGMAHKYTGRYDVTWPRMIERRLNARGYKVVESALCSRTTSWDDPFDNDWLVGGEPHDFNGLAHFAPDFMSHECRAVVILLGTNDLKVRIRSQTRMRGRNLDAYAIANSCAKIGLLAREVHKSLPRLRNHPLTVVLVAPPQVRLNQLSRELGYDETSVKLSADFPAAYRRVCKENDFEFVEVPGIEMDKSVDGVHLTPEGTREVAEAVWELLEKVLEKKPPIPSLTPPDLDEGSDADLTIRQAPGRGRPKGSGNTGVQNGASKSTETPSNAKRRGRPPGPGPSNMNNKRVQRGRTSNGRMARSDSNSSSESDDGASHTSSDEESANVQGLTRDLVWIQCDECQKWRMTISGALLKPHWTCKNEFWSDRLEEWKAGCGWSADQLKDGQKHERLYRGARVTKHSMPGTIAGVLPSVRKALAEVEDHRSVKTTHKKEKDDRVNLSLGGSSSAPVLIVGADSTPVVWAKTSILSPSHDELLELAKKQASAAAAAVKASQAAAAAAAENPVKNTEPMKAKRGRPLGSVSKRKPEAAAQATTSVPPPAMPTASGRVYPSTAAGIMVPKALKPIPSSQTSSIIDHALPAQPFASTGGRGMPQGFVSVIPNVISPYVGAQGGTQIVMPHMGMIPQMLPGIPHAQPPQNSLVNQAQQQHAQQQQADDIINNMLVPAVERIMANIPPQYNPKVQQVLNTLKSEHQHPLNLVHALAELRGIFVSYPNFVQEIDSIAQRHPVLQMWFQPQQYIFFDPNTMNMQSMFHPGTQGQGQLHFMAMPMAPPGPSGGQAQSS